MIVKGKKRDRSHIARSDRQSDTREDDSADDMPAKALFQRAFEARFTPLKKSKSSQAVQQINHDHQSSEEDDLDAWSGIESGEDETHQHQNQHQQQQVEVVEVDDNHHLNDMSRLAEQKAFMSSGLPRQASSHSFSKESPADQPDDVNEKANLKNDMALERLLKESHLLKQNDNRSGSEVQGAARLKALDLRIQDLGGKSSHLEQQRMPFSHKRGIAAKANERETKRRKEAAENGIVLERAKAAVKAAAPRSRDVGSPGIGRFRGGMLKLSSKDVRSIQGDRPARPQGRKRGR